MLDSTHSPIADPELAAMLECMSRLGVRLSWAALRLGGPAAEERARNLQERLAHSTRASRRDRRDLERLHELLTLQHVEDPERLEASLFSSLDPASPEVADLCLLADELADVLEALPEPTHAPGASA
ncbi:MAG: hypothetical protein ACQEUZ_04620 [Pseudomonadota bacterium]